MEIARVVEVDHYLAGTPGRIIVLPDGGEHGKGSYGASDRPDDFSDSHAAFSFFTIEIPRII
jgi:hypothetical protein